MRTLRFREVLWGVAYKLGLDPQQSNFLSNQAISIGSYIEENVRRDYDGRDIPEWTATHQFTPDSRHIVTWDAIAKDLVPTAGDNAAGVQIGRVLKVYLTDPKTSNGPVETRFTLLDDGVHCGFDHGLDVWIEYMKPAPRYSAETWTAGRTYQQDDPTYSYTTGECYRSKGGNNIGNDPATSFNPPPPTVNVDQPFEPYSPGVPEQTQIVTIPITSFIDPIPPTLSLPTPFPDPESGTYQIRVADDTGVQIGIAGHAGTTGDTYASIVSALAGSLDASLPVAFVVTANTTLFTITLEHPSNFSVSQAYYSPTDPASQIYRFRVAQVRPYRAEIPPNPGQPEIISMALNSQTTFPGGLYTLYAVTQGTTHMVEYQSALTDSGIEILNGLSDAIRASTDVWWAGVSVFVNGIDKIMDLTINEVANVYCVITVDGSPWWELIPFPRAIADQVIRGAYADLLKEWGQTDKGLAEEQMVPFEQQVTEQKFDTTPAPPLTGQQRALSRYRQ